MALNGLCVPMCLSAIIHSFIRLKSDFGKWSSVCFFLFGFRKLGDFVDSPISPVANWR